ncbi:MAG: hypothetical protein GY811_05960 [Myxococcales bacterium]|nr:hypothetical protein [Myxococcales bacterium]
MRKKDHPLGEILAWDPKKGEPRTSFLSIKIEGFQRAWSFNLAKEGNSKKNPNRSGLSLPRKAFRDHILMFDIEPGTEVLRYHVSRPARVNPDGLYEPAWQMFDFRTPVEMVPFLIEAMKNGMFETAGGAVALDPEELPEGERVYVSPAELIKRGFDGYNAQPGRQDYDPARLLEEEGRDAMREKVLKCATLCMVQKQLWIDKNGFQEVVQKKPKSTGRRFSPAPEPSGVDRETLKTVIKEILREEGIIE